MFGGVQNTVILTIDIWLNGIIAAVAVLGFAASLYFSRASLRKVHEQINLQNRPVLKLRVLTEMKPKRQVEIINIGTGPAFNVKYVSSIMEESSGLLGLKVMNAHEIGSLGVNEAYQLEFNEDIGFPAVYIKYAKEMTDMEHDLFTPILYEDIFGERYVSENRVKVGYDNVLIYKSNPPRNLTKEEQRKVNELSAK
ncbi:hypothetical protein ACHAL6_11690 [Proteiniclasticum sp. C24MP]|uniref:hypothetical protein n=1 Tax=Proteiniclasticum sp. C24MP TaxID=3374101 RepID=UPI0037547DD7